jgi:hypothetical protein
VGGAAGMGALLGVRPSRRRVLRSGDMSSPPDKRVTGLARPDVWALEWKPPASRKCNNQMALLPRRICRGIWRWLQKGNLGERDFLATGGEPRRLENRRPRLGHWGHPRRSYENVGNAVPIEEAGLQGILYRFDTQRKDIGNVSVSKREVPLEVPALL